MSRKINQPTNYIDSVDYRSRLLDHLADIERRLRNSSDYKDRISSLAGSLLDSEQSRQLADMIPAMASLEFDRIWMDVLYKLIEKERSNRHWHALYQIPVKIENARSSRNFIDRFDYAFNVIDYWLEQDRREVLTSDEEDGSVSPSRMEDWPRKNSRQRHVSAENAETFASAQATENAESSEQQASAGETQHRQAPENAESSVIRQAPESAETSALMETPVQEARPRFGQLAERSTCAAPQNPESSSDSDSENSGSEQSAANKSGSEKDSDAEDEFVLVRTRSGRIIEKYDAKHLKPGERVLNKHQLPKTWLRGAHIKMKNKIDLATSLLIPGSTAHWRVYKNHHVQLVREGMPDWRTVIYPPYWVEWKFPERAEQLLRDMRKKHKRYFRRQQESDDPTDGHQRRKRSYPSNEYVDDSE